MIPVAHPRLTNTLSASDVFEGMEPRMTMTVTMLGTGAPLHPDRAMTGMVVTAPGCAPLMIDTCGGFELIRQMHKVGLERDAVRNVIVTHRHLDHAGGIQALLLARVPLEIYANADTHDGIRTMTRLPGALIVIDVHREHNAVREARKLSIPTVCLIDTRPRDLGAADLATLRDLRDLALEEIQRTQA